MESTDLSRFYHDLRTPMATILSSTELLQYYSDSLSQEKKDELLVQIKTAVNEILSLVELLHPGR